MKRSPLIYIPLVLLLLTACSTKKNTSLSRFWHSFNAHFNTYFNGQEAYKEGIKAQQEGNKDDFTQTLPVFCVGNEASRGLGKSNFETAITKSKKAIQVHSIKKRPTQAAGKTLSPKKKAYLQRKEFNPFLKHAWLMMGRAQFQTGEFLEAAATFSYITRLYAAEPEVAAEARLWLARCYAQVGWFYDAEDAFSKSVRDSLPSRLRKVAELTQADMLVGQKRYEEALPHLAKAVKTVPAADRARLYYLLGQLYYNQNQPKLAYKALQKCIKHSPPYATQLNARLLQAEVLSGDAAGRKKMIARLKRMARSDNNKDYLDQVYFALGNIYMQLADTAQAIAAYEKGRAKSTRGGIEKGVLVLRLGEIYWDQRRFDQAQSCYAEAIGLLNKQREGYEEAMRRSKVLDKLVPYTSAVHLQDSLQALARMDEPSRNAAIDRVIEALKKKEEEERRAKADSAAEARAAEIDADNRAAGTRQNNRPPQVQNPQQQSDLWYFYNPMTVMQGKQDFQKKWGKRKNEDDWRRSNRTVLAMDDAEGFDYAADDSLQAVRDSLEQLGITEEPADTAQAELAPEDDPHRREYYIKQIPFTPEAVEASDAIIKDGLYNAGVIEKDDLEDFPLAAETLERLVNNYKDFEQMEDALYQLFLLYSRAGRRDMADATRRRMAAEYPEGKTTRTITAPDYERTARYGKEIEDSLYTAAYTAYTQGDTATVGRNYRLSTSKFPMGLNRPKFIFVHALSRLATADTKQLITELKDLVRDYPKSDVSDMAGMIVRGLESGRALGTGGYDLTSLWSRRTALSDSISGDAEQQRALSPERNAAFVFILAYPADSIADNRLLYEMARFNFSTFMARGFDMSFVRDEGLTQFRITGFNSLDEAHAYALRAHEDAALRELMGKGRVVLISEENLKMLGTFYSFDDYAAFYEQTFAPAELDPELPVEDIEPIEQHYEDEYTPEQLEQMNEEKDENASEDDGEWYGE